VRVIADVRPLDLTVRIFNRRNLIYLTAALSFAFVGYGVAALQTKRAEAVERAMTATAELWYFYEVLRTLQDGDTKSALGATAIKADHAVWQIAEAEDRLLSKEQREFRTRVLKDYRSFREAHPALYVLSPQIGQQEREDMLRTQREVSEFLKRVAR